MSKSRLEAFSDGVIAIIITIMVLEMKAPRGDTWDAVRPLIPMLLSYVLSFVYVGIYWNNHHHMLQTVRKVNGPILWANLHLLFWLSLVPLVTSWLGQNHVSPLAVALYDAVLLMAGVAYYILSRALIASEGANSPLATAVGIDVKVLASIALYAVAIPLAFASPWVSIGLYVVVALIWFVPDRRIEKSLGE